VVVAVVGALTAIVATKRNALRAGAQDASAVHLLLMEKTGERFTVQNVAAKGVGVVVEMPMTNKMPSKAADDKKKRVSCYQDTGRK